ncbi:MAG TPA: glycosyltransferase family 39 protein, partial [Candidatus Saccharimonadales bacterium]|nr:glycosyltransferase family 39 protein [Candidatus Saccharimonadales bacterium]
MKHIRRQLAAHRRTYSLLAVALVVVCCLLLYKLGSLVGGLSSGEVAASRAAVGWHGIYHQPLYLPLKLVRSAVFWLFSDHGQTLTRLPNTLFGLLAIVAFAWLVRVWHGSRTALFAGCLFAASAWGLHVSRLASFDVLYLWALPTLLATHVAHQRHNRRWWVFYGSLLVWGLLLYVPGLIWLLLFELFTNRQAIREGWRHFGAWWQRLIYLLAGLIWLPLLLDRLRQTATLKT